MENGYFVVEPLDNNSSPNRVANDNNGGDFACTSGHLDLLEQLRRLARPLEGLERLERQVQLHKTKIKRLRAVNRHLENQLERRRQGRCDRPTQTEGTPAGALAHSFVARARAQQQQQQQPRSTPSVAKSATHPAPPPPSASLPPTAPLCLRQQPRLQLVNNRHDAAGGCSAELNWRLAGMSPEQCQAIVGYEIFYYYERAGQTPLSSLWLKNVDVRALRLPMRCSVDLDALRGVCHFVLRAKDNFGRMGVWSNVCSWHPPAIDLS